MNVQAYRILSNNSIIKPAASLNHTSLFISSIWHQFDKMYTNQQMNFVSSVCWWSHAAHHGPSSTSSL